jgi:Resolvase, N terminal domain
VRTGVHSRGSVRDGVRQEFTDHAISGATLLRSGFQALMRDALNRRFDVVLAESLDRFSRDQEDTAGLFKRLTFASVNIVTLAEMARIYRAKVTELATALQEPDSRSEAPRRCAASWTPSCSGQTRAAGRFRLS